MNRNKKGANRPSPLRRGAGGEGTKFRDRSGETLFNDDHRMGHLVDRVHRELMQEEIREIPDAYHAWKKGDGYDKRPGWWKSMPMEEIQELSCVLTPGRYVRAGEQDNGTVPFEGEMVELTTKLHGHLEEAHRLETQIKKNLEVLYNGK